MRIKDLLKYKTIIFDCDGVILASNKVKTESFRKVLEDDPVELQDNFINFHTENGGISRFYKFKRYYTEINPALDVNNAINTALLSFSNIVKQELLCCSEVEGIRKVLEFLKYNKVNCFVNSGGAQTELAEIFQAKKLDCYFKKILGSPKTKSENMQELIQENLFQNPALFIGDSYSDLKTAQEFSCDFIFVKKYSEWEEGLDTVRLLDQEIINTFEDLL